MQKPPSHIFYQSYSKRYHVDLFKSEVEMLNRALDESKRFVLADQIRKYALSLEQRGLNEQDDYIAWLRAKADWIDPTTATQDETFGLFKSLESFPKKRADIKTDIPYKVKWFFERRGYAENQTWQQFTEIVDENSR